MQRALRPALAPAPLRDLDFMDLYVRLDAPGLPHFRPGATQQDAPQDCDLPEEFHDDAAVLTEHLATHFKTLEESFTYDKMRLRATRLETANGEIWAALRRIPNEPMAIEQLGFAPPMVPVMEEMGQRSGLILICGASGQGKTTTAASLLDRYLEDYGGVAFTIEDPVEYDMQGRRGHSGYCYQSEAHDDEQWGPLLKRALRWHPRYIMVGEIRTPDAADQALRAATSGHTVLTTMHAGSMEEALEGLLQLAEHNLGERAPTLLAAGLIGVVYQTFTPSGLYGRLMLTEADNPGSPIRALIRERRIGQTRTFADQQMARLAQNGRVF